MTRRNAIASSFPRNRGIRGGLRVRVNIVPRSRGRTCVPVSGPRSHESYNRREDKEKKEPSRLVVIPLRRNKGDNRGCNDRRESRKPRGLTRITRKLHAKMRPIIGSMRIHSAARAVFAARDRLLCRANV